MFKPENVDAYVAAYPPEIQDRLQQLRQLILKHAPYAHETLNYRMPAFKQDGTLLVHFAVGKEHIAFYPGHGCLETFRNDLAPYKCVKGAVQFPLDRKLPVQLLTQIIKHRVTELSHMRNQKRK